VQFLSNLPFKVRSVRDLLVDGEPPKGFGKELKNHVEEILRTGTFSKLETMKVCFCSRAVFSNLFLAVM